MTESGAGAGAGGLCELAAVQEAIEDEEEEEEEEEQNEPDMSEENHMDVEYITEGEEDIEDIDEDDVVRQEQQRLLMGGSRKSRNFFKYEMFY